MRIHPRGLIVFAVFVIALALASGSRFVSLAALGAVFIEACLIRGIVLPGTDDPIARRAEAMAADTPLRPLLGKLLAWEDAHVSFDAVVANVPEELRGTQPAGLPHSLWQLVEHLRITQHDILDFCVNPQYEEMKWPDDYWPRAGAPPDAPAWNASIEQYRRDRQALVQLAADTSRDLDLQIPHGSGQTYLRELMLVADHTAYHVGQIVLVRRLLGIWPA